MAPADIVSHLITWTPFLLEGFAWNILIALTASALGTAVGCILAGLSEGSSRILSRASLRLSELFLTLPTIGMLFYAAVLLPNEVQLSWSNETYLFPTWTKAALALSSAQIGFTSHHMVAAIRFWRQGNHGAALLFIPSWGSNLLITIIASTGASLVGVSELVSRCNQVINAADNADLMIPFYVYASLFFIAFCYPLTVGMRRLKATLLSRFCPSGL